MSSRYFGSANPVKPHLLQATGGLSAEITDLRGDIETAFNTQQTEAAKPTASLPATPFTGQICWDTTASVLKVWNGASWASTAAAAGTLAADLASTAAGKGASLVGIQDAATLYTATTVEAALAEVMGVANGKWATPTPQAITGALSTVVDAPAKAVLTSIISALVTLGLATDSTT